MGKYLTLFATNWYIPFVIWYNICIDIMLFETVKFLKQLRHMMQGRTMQNKRAKYLNNSVICSVSLKPSLYLKLFNKYFCTVAFKNVQIFYQYSIVVSETHVYVKASSATHGQRAKVPIELNKRIPLRRYISKDLSCK